MTDRLKEIQERLEKATPGPWSGVLGLWIAGYSANDCLRGDIAFLSSASQDIPFLLSEIERVTAERDELKAKHEPELTERVKSAIEIIARLETPDKKLHFWDNVLAERDRLREALEVAKTALKGLEWIGNGKGYYCVSDERAANAMKAIKEIERIESGGQCCAGCPDCKGVTWKGPGD